MNPLHSLRINECISTNSSLRLPRVSSYPLLRNLKPTLVIVRHVIRGDLYIPRPSTQNNLHLATSFQSEKAQHDDVCCDHTPLGFVHGVHEPVDVAKAFVDPGFG